MVFIVFIVLRIRLLIICCICIWLVCIGGSLVFSSSVMVMLCWFSLLCDSVSIFFMVWFRLKVCCCGVVFWVRSWMWVIMLLVWCVLVRMWVMVCCVLFMFGGFCVS